MNLKQLVMLLKLTVFLVRKKVIIMPTLIIKTLHKLVIILSKLDITMMLSKELIMVQLYHIYLMNLWKPQRVLNSKDLLVTSLSQMQFKLLDSTLNMPSTPQLRRVTCSMSQRVWNKICKEQDFTSTNKRNLPWWTCKNSSKSLNFLKNGKLWSPEALKRNYLRPMFDMYNSKRDID